MAGWKEIRDSFKRDYATLVTMKDVCKFCGCQYSKACEILYGLEPVIGTKGRKGARYFVDEVAKKIVGLEVKQ